MTSCSAMRSHVSANPMPFGLSPTCHSILMNQMANRLEEHQRAIEQELSKLPGHVQDHYNNLQSELKLLSSEANRWKDGINQLGKKLQALEDDLRRSPTKMREFELQVQINQLTARKLELQARNLRRIGMFEAPKTWFQYIHSNTLRFKHATSHHISMVGLVVVFGQDASTAVLIRTGWRARILSRSPITERGNNDDDKEVQQWDWQSCQWCKSSSNWDKAVGGSSANW